MNKFGCSHVQLLLTCLEHNQSPGEWFLGMGWSAAEVGNFFSSDLAKVI